MIKITAVYVDKKATTLNGARVLLTNGANQRTGSVIDNHNNDMLVEWDDGAASVENKSDYSLVRVAFIPEQLWESAMEFLKPETPTAPIAPSSAPATPSMSWADKGLKQDTKSIRQWVKQKSDGGGVAGLTDKQQNRYENKVDKAAENYQQNQGLIAPGVSDLVNHFGPGDTNPITGETIKAPTSGGPIKQDIMNSVFQQNKSQDKKSQQPGLWM